MKVLQRPDDGSAPRAAAVREEVPRGAPVRREVFVFTSRIVPRGNRPGSHGERVHERPHHSDLDTQSGALDGREGIIYGGGETVLDI